MEEKEIAALIEAGDASLGLELGSTRIKAVLVAPTSETIAVGSYGWENERQDGIWTYALSAVWEGIAACYLDLAQNVTDGLHVNEKIVERTVKEYLPFIATENLLMEAVKRGGNRQDLHEIIRKATDAKELYRKIVGNSMEDTME